MMTKKNTLKDPNKKPCRNCGKPMPIANPYCYSCGTIQKTGEIEPAFSIKKIPLTGNLTFGGSVSKEEGLRCVRCESNEELQYYVMSKSVKKKEVGAPFTRVYTSKPSFKFPICDNCADKFRKWKIIRFIFVAVVILWIVLSIILLEPLSISVSLDTIITRVIYVFIMLGTIIISYAILSKHSNNPNNWMLISGYFDLSKNYRYQGKVHPHNSKEWIIYEKWVDPSRWSEKIKKREEHTYIKEAPGISKQVPVQEEPTNSNKMVCPHCGVLQDQGTKFCTKCGQKIE